VLLGPVELAPSHGHQTARRQRQGAIGVAVARQLDGLQRQRIRFVEVLVGAQLGEQVGEIRLDEAPRDRFTHLAHQLDRVAHQALGVMPSVEVPHARAEAGPSHGQHAAISGALVVLCGPLRETQRRIGVVAQHLQEAHLPVSGVAAREMVVAERRVELAQAPHHTFGDGSTGEHDVNDARVAEGAHVLTEQAVARALREELLRLRVDHLAELEACEGLAARLCMRFGCPGGKSASARSLAAQPEAKSLR
jgi:hypothetical protein